MCSLGIPDWDNTVRIHDNNVRRIVNDYLLRGYIMVDVDYKFPKDIKYPCLTESLNETSSGYFREGRTVCTGYELKVALDSGCEITVNEGVLIPFTNSKDKPYESVIKCLQEERRKYKKGTLMNGLYKQMGNSLYGQTGQGYANKRKFNSRTGGLNVIPGSELSNPLAASHISGYVRALVGEMINQIDKTGGLILSCTTDGFITTEGDLLNKLNNDHPLIEHYSNLRDKLSGDRDVVELRDVSTGMMS